MFFNVKMNAISLATGSRPNDWDCSKAEWGDQMGDAPRASTPRRRLNFVFPFFLFFLEIFFLLDSAQIIFMKKNNKNNKKEEN